MHLSIQITTVSEKRWAQKRALLKATVKHCWVSQLRYSICLATVGVSYISAHPLSAAKSTDSEDKSILTPPAKTTHQKKREINISPTQKQV